MQQFGPAGRLAGRLAGQRAGQAAGLPAFRSFDLRGSEEFPAVAAWLAAMGARPPRAKPRFGGGAKDGTPSRRWSDVSRIEPRNQWNGG